MPMHAGLVFEPCPRNKRLSDREPVVENLPGSQVPCQNSQRQAVAQLALDAQVSFSRVVLADCGTKQQIAGEVSSDKRSTAPRPAYGELQACESIARMQALRDKRTRLADEAAIHRDPIEK